MAFGSTAVQYLVRRVVLIVFSPSLNAESTFIEFLQLEAGKSKSHQRTDG